jgi:hypothetical protein
VPWIGGQRQRRLDPEAPVGAGFGGQTCRRARPPVPACPGCRCPGRPHRPVWTRRGRRRRPAGAACRQRRRRRPWRRRPPCVPAYALVRASCTIRYAARSTAAGTAPADPHGSDGSPAARHVLDQPVEIGQPKRRCPGARAVRRAPPRPRASGGTESGLSAASTPRTSLSASALASLIAARAAWAPPAGCRAVQPDAGPDVDQKGGGRASCSSRAICSRSSPAWRRVCSRRPGSPGTGLRATSASCAP